MNNIFHIYWGYSILKVLKKNKKSQEINEEILNDNGIVTKTDVTILLIFLNIKNYSTLTFNFA